MRPSYRFTPEAAEDLAEIWDYIARDSVEAANRVEEAIHEAAIFLARAPFSGHRRSQATKLDVRFWPLSRYPNYLLVYRPGTRPLEVFVCSMDGVTSRACWNNRT